MDAVPEPVRRQYGPPYTLMLTVVLAGIVLGSLLASRLFDRLTRHARYFGALQVLTGLSLLMLMKLRPEFWRGIGSELWICFLLILPNAVLSGASFPLAVRMVSERIANISSDAGKMSAVNTIGGISGALLVGFLGLPFLGLEASMLWITGVSLANGLVAWLWLDRSAPLLRRMGMAVVPIAIWWGILAGTTTRIPEDFLGEHGQLVDFREGFGSNLAVVLRRDGLRLEIDRLWQGEARKNHQIMTAHVPMILHPNPRDILVVGIGTGKTASRFLMYDVRRVDCVDIEPTIFDFVRKHFDSPWMDDERVSLILEDGRNYLWHSRSRYDVVSLELGQVFRPGVAFFYTRDFYRRAKERLNPGGMLVQFIPLQFFEPDQFRGAVNTFLQVFPNSYLWYNAAELLLIGVCDGQLTITRDTLRRLSANARVQEDLEYAYWGGPAHWLNQSAVFLGGFLAGPQALARLANDSIYRDDLPVLDYTTKDAFDAIGVKLENVDMLRPLLGSIEALADFELSGPEVSRVRSMQQKNLGAIVVGTYMEQAQDYVVAGLYEKSVIPLQEATGHNPEHFNLNRLLAESLLLLGRAQEAEVYFRRAIQVRPRDAQCRHGLGTLLLQRGEVDEAIRHFEAALETRPDDAGTHKDLGLALARRGRLLDALRHLQKAVALRPGDAAAERSLKRIRAALRKQGESNL
ncbi:MAG: fused MFS/spermidine synthase [Candidatus Krumholzibacteriia bacterium]